MVNLMIQEIHKLIGQFDYEKFFSYSGPTIVGASGIITSHQALTISNPLDGMLPHITTFQMMATAIYNSSKPIIDEEINRLLLQSIRMRLLSGNGQKWFIILFPDKLTREQVNLLSAYQNTYGKIIEKFSIDHESQDNSLKIVFRECNGKEVCSHSFEEAVKYAQTLPIVEKTDEPYESIIGQVISPDGSTLCNYSELGRVCDTALNEGVTLAECRGAGEKIADPCDRTGDR